jgi:putative NADPH-quinone reductase
MTRILIIRGHPDRAGTHFCHALADSYADGARAAGHEVRDVAVAGLDFAPLGSPLEWEQAAPEAVRQQQADIAWAEHMVIFYPLWLGSMPARLHAFWEQVLRPGFAIEKRPKGMYRKLLTGRSARIVITMGMPALIYRWYFGAHSLKSFERNVLHFVGIRPIRESLIGGIAAIGDKRRAAWLKTLHDLGRKGG